LFLPISLFFAMQSSSSRTGLMFAIFAAILVVLIITWFARNRTTPIPSLPLTSSGILGSGAITDSNSTNVVSTSSVSLLVPTFATGITNSWSKAQPDFPTWTNIMPNESASVQQVGSLSWAFVEPNGPQ
jgi:hypothetical protein